MATITLCNQLCLFSRDFCFIFCRGVFKYRTLALRSSRRIHVSSINRQIESHVSRSLRESYKLLEVTENSSLKDIREAYLNLARLYHPDSGGETADSKKFAQVGIAYEAVVNHKKGLDELAEEHDMYKTAEDSESREEKDFDIRHTAPQHRQYLSNEGVGFGTPSQRQKQYQQHRVHNAAESVLDHKIRKFGQNETSIAQPEKKAIKKRIITQAVDRLVEDLIQEAMSKGEFTNLPGSGKPLKVDQSEHYIDNSTHRLNKIIIDSGFAPEWITLDKEIRTDIKLFREFLVKEQVKIILHLTNMQTRENLKKQCTAKILHVNHKIDKFNLIVPILTKQRVHVSLERECKRCEEMAQIESKCIKKKNFGAISKVKERKESRWEMFIKKWTVLRKMLGYFRKK